MQEVDIRLPLLVLMACVTSFFLNWVARLIAPRLGWVDRPDGKRKLHGRVTPLMGGAAVFLALSVTLIVARCWVFPEAELATRRLLALLCSGGVFCLVGLWDDRRPMEARVKFIWQLVGCVPFLIWGQEIESIGLFGMDVPLGRLSTIFVLFWLVSCTNVINLLDGLDGLAGTVTLIIMGTLTILAWTTGNTAMAAVSAVVGASVLGFLLHNWPPAKIFLGDAGSLTLGFLVGAVSIEACQKSATGFTLVPPLVALSIPVFDTVMAILRRKLTGQSIGTADRGHIHHRLQARGLSGRQTLLAISGLCLVMGVAVVASAWAQTDWVAGTVCAAVLLILVVGRIFGHDELTTLLGRLRTLVEGTRPVPAHPAQSVSMVAWSEVQRRAAEMGPLRLEMTYKDRPSQESPQRISWATETANDKATPTWNFEYSLPGADDSQVNVSLVGYRVERPDPQEVDELVRIVQTLTHDWPRSVAQGETTLTPALPESQVDSAAFQPERRAA